jgi:hypothetical protein
VTGLRLAGSTVAIALSIGGCGSDGKTSTDSSPRAATSTTAAAQATGPRLRGADYAFNLASGWSDTTKRHATTGGVDRTFAKRVPHAVAVVAMLKAPSGQSISKLLRAKAKRETAGAHATAVTATRPLKLSGASAITYQYRATTRAGSKIQARQVLAVHKGRLHVITLIAARSQFATADNALGAMLGTWRWTA